MEKFVLKGPDYTNPIPDESIASFLHPFFVQNIDNGDLFTDVDNNKNLTYREFFTKICRCAEAMKNIGIKKGDVVTISSENDVNYFVPIFGALYIGAIVVPTNFTYTEFELLHSLKTIKPNIVFCSSNSLETFLGIKKDFPTIKKLVVIDTEDKLEGSESLEAFINSNSPQIDPITYKAVPVNAKEDVAFILFSSGTTGLPKAVMITHWNYNARTNLQFEKSIMREVAGKNVLGILPFFHAYGLSIGMGVAIPGKKIIVVKYFDPLTYLKLIQDYKMEILFAVPPLMHFLAKSPIVDEFDLSGLKEIICGAGALTESVENAVKKRLKINSIRQGFGMTETTLGVTFTPVEAFRPGSCGKLLPGISAIVRDPETGKLLGPNAAGELCFKGPVIMKGYYNNPEANKEIFTEDGWLKTGDIGYYDNDGFFFIVDRLKELIKYKGFQVAPSELEGILLTNPKIKDAAVIGKPHERDGEHPLAFIVKQDDVELTENEVINYVAGFVSKRKQLHGGVIFTDDIPKNPSGKILRRELRESIKKKMSKL
nr:luciferin 4-monooxygenase-like [Onthophagus taurus]